MWTTQEYVDETPWKHGHRISLAVPTASAERLLASSGWQRPMSSHELCAVILVGRKVRREVLAPEPLREGGQVGVGIGPGPHCPPIGAKVQVLYSFLVRDAERLPRIPGPVQAY